MKIDDKIKYYKYEYVIFDNQKYQLIDFIKMLREKAKLSKRQMSQIIKGNTSSSWYAQLEQGDVNSARRKNIKQSELTDLISVLVFGARSSSEIDEFKDSALNYLDNVISVKPIMDKESGFTKISNYTHIRPQEVQDEMVATLSNSISQNIVKGYQKLSDPNSKDVFIDNLKAFNRALIVDSNFISTYISLPAEFILSWDNAQKESILDSIEKYLDNSNLTSDKFTVIQDIKEIIMERYSNNTPIISNDDSAFDETVQHMFDDMD